MTINPPIAAGTLWTAVMDRAGGQCECRGECGKSHVGDARCVTFDAVRAQRRRLVRELEIAPLEVAPMTFAAAAALPADKLRARCGDCAARCRRQVAAVKRRDRQDEALDLFDVSEFRPARAAGGDAA
ncbi:hypothetical protein [Streptomyces bohaiensis]|uniref:Uncharacterized protein n=1 Tax=Streptomyces bohaiensis TaxID=1431344 RepID=A0ABX1CAC6_9ACTN|nr:hypothetical protein [Streptomyces bohaiensis]NJQ14197.1 hypothetical protein [Streptomyces bohaiensis]